MKTKTTLLPYELDAIQAWATLHGRCWKNALREAWYSGNYHGFADYGTLQSIRNNPAYGPEWLNAFTLPTYDGLQMLQDAMEASRCPECTCSGYQHFERCTRIQF